ncbi:MAG: hypothetical protein NVS3B12_15720 [Acidimicrobiales bacterium]
MSIHPRSTAGGGRRYDVRLRTPSGALYSRTFRTRKEAERFEDTERSARSRGTWIDPRQADTRFAEVAADWLESVPGKKESTISRDISSLNNHLLPALGPVPIGAIGPADVQKLVTRWSKTPHLARSGASMRCCAPCSTWPSTPTGSGAPRAARSSCPKSVPSTTGSRPRSSSTASWG